MNKIGKNLTPKQTRALEMILTGSSVVEVAEAAKVSRGTVYNWLSQPIFTTAMNDEKALAMERLSLSLAALGVKAIKTLDDAMDDPEAGTSVKVRAADIVINRILSMREFVDVEERLVQLESIVQSRK